MTPLFLLLLAVGLVAVEHLAFGRFGVNLADEGYLWYGALRTAEGLVPMEDFRSYDPGRYYWCAPWVRLFGPSLVVVRVAASAFLAVGIWAALLVANRATDEPAELVLIGLGLVLWSHPRWKRFEHALSLIGALSVLWILENPTTGWLFAAGVVAGAAAYFGRNHALYIVLAHIGAIGYSWLWLDALDRIAPVGAWIAGGVVGYAPMWTRWVFKAGSFRFYVHEKVLVFARRRGTNFGVPIPWPWKFRSGGRPTALAIADLFHRVLLLATPVFLAGILVWAAAEGASGPAPWLLAASAVGMLYLHQALGRADLSHLCQGLPPAWLALGALISRLDLGVASVLGWAGYLAVIVATVVPISPLGARFVLRTRHERQMIGGREFQVTRRVASVIRGVERSVDDRLSADDPVFIAPFAPGLYSVLGRRAPVHNTYMLFPERDEKQDEIVADLRRHGLAMAVIQREPGRFGHERSFEQTHPIVWRFISETMRELDGRDLPSGWVAFEAADRS